MSNQIIINIADANSTEPYLKILKKYNINIRRTYKAQEDRVSAFSKELKKLDDEEARTRIPNKQIFELLNTVLGQIELKKKSKGRKLTTPKSIMTFIQQEKERCIREDETKGEIEAFAFNLLDARMNSFHNVPLLPRTDFRKNIDPSIRMKIAEYLVEPILIKQQTPSKIDVNKITKKILEIERLADEKLVINVINDLLERK